MTIKLGGQQLRDLLVHLKKGSRVEAAVTWSDIGQVKLELLMAARLA